MSLNEIGFKTKLVIGPNSLNIKNEDNLEVINVTTAKQMFEACKDNLPVDVAVCTAAESDYKVKNYSEEKIKKEKPRSGSFSMVLMRPPLGFTSVSE